MSNKSDGNSGCGGCFVLIVTVLLINTGFFSWLFRAVSNYWGWILFAAFFIVLFFKNQYDEERIAAEKAVREIIAEEERKNEQQRLEAQSLARIKWEAEEQRLKRGEASRIEAELRRREADALARRQREQEDQRRKEAERLRDEAELRRIAESESRRNIESSRIEKQTGPSLFRQAQAAILAKNYDIAYSRLVRAAELGHAEAQLRLGDYYSNRFESVAMQVGSACEICGESTFINYKCMACGTVCLSDAFHAPQLDYEKACEWYNLAVTNGLVEARYRMCVARYFGIGVPRHFPSAKRLFDSIPNWDNEFIYPPPIPSCRR